MVHEVLHDKSGKMGNIPTIFALSTAPGRAGVAVVRVSGPESHRVLDLMVGKKLKPRMAAGRAFRHPRTAEPLDRGIAIWFPAPASFTGEDVAELQIHGGRAVVKAVLAALAEIPGCRMAEPGEFARRAFDSGKIDLAEVEGLADLIDAETEAQRRQALRQARGDLSGLYDGWRASLIEAQALVEATIDFADEAEITGDAMARAAATVETIHTAMRHHLDDGHRGEILRTGFRIVLAGPPNAGKSTLLNALARRDAAIVSDEAGTTRDCLEVHLDLGGLPVILTDTAGIRKTTGKVEQEGIRRTLERAREADLILWLGAADEGETALPDELREKADKVLSVLSKADLLAQPEPASPSPHETREAGAAPALPDDMVAISARTGAGMDELTHRLAAIASERIGRPGEEPVITQERHRQSVTAAADALAVFLAGDQALIELRAEDLRHAADALGRITGRIDPEHVLGEIFSRFCLGK